MIGAEVESSCFSSLVETGRWLVVDMSSGEVLIFSDLATSNAILFVFPPLAIGTPFITKIQRLLYCSKTSSFLMSFICLFSSTVDCAFTDMISISCFLFDCSNFSYSLFIAYFYTWYIQILRYFSLQVSFPLKK